jgi:hypothetical protein
MNDTVDVKDGEPSLGVYLIQYDEDQWFRYDEAGWQFCYDTWIKKASAIPGIKLVVLRLIPDAIFPRDPEKPLPYILWQQEVVRPENDGFKFTGHVLIELERPLDPSMRARIEKALLAYPSGTTYEAIIPSTFETEAGPIDGSTRVLIGKVQH